MIDLRRVRRYLWVGVLLCVTLPASASGAVAIGSNLAATADGGSSCSPDLCTGAHQVLPPTSTAGGGLVAPSDGIVVRWRIKVGDVIEPAALRITRPGDSDTRTGAGTGAAVTLAANQTSTFDARLPIQAGDAGGVFDPAPDPPPATDPGEYEERSLRLAVGRRPEIHKRVGVRATGFADSLMKLWVFADPRGKACPATPSAHGPRARHVFSAVSVQGNFRVKGRVKMRSRGRHNVCGYLGAADGSGYTTAFKTRKVRRRRLQAPRARRTVARALRRHEFAGRVVENLKRHCRRRNRAMFSCRFSSAFPGYRLTGRGPVRLNRHLSYRFRARVDDLHIALTDDNEGRFPG